MVRTKDSLVSIIGSSYSQPIADLIDRWFSKIRPKSNSVQSGYHEHGYAASVTLLLVAMLESYIVRVRYIQRSKIKKNIRSALDLLLYLYPHLPNRKALTDVYVLRDTIFHNHLWEIEYSFGGSPDLVLHSAVKDPAFGDSKYTDRVNPDTRRTKALGLSVVPTRVDRRDVHKVFKTVWKILLFLEKKDMNQCYVSIMHVRFRGKMILFSDLLAHLEAWL